MSLVLYGYFRSSASFRVRIALNLKGLEYKIRPVHLIRNRGEQNLPEYLSMNPQGLVPTLIDGETILTQSSAIIEYLEEMYPIPLLLPNNSADRAYVRSLVQLIACEIHPLNNLKVLNYLKNTIHYNDSKTIWYKHWIDEGFSALENKLEQHGCNGLYCFAETAGIADTFLIPQVYNAMRFNCELKPYPLISSIYNNCRQQLQFFQAAPESQSEAGEDSVL